MKIAIISPLILIIVTTLLGQFALAGSDACDKKCLSFCMYYHSSDSCVKTCQCDEFASKMAPEQTSLLKSAFSSPVNPHSLIEQTQQVANTTDTETPKNVTTDIDQTKLPDTNSTETEGTQTNSDDTDQTTDIDQLQSNITDSNKNTTEPVNGGNQTSDDGKDGEESTQGGETSPDGQTGKNDTEPVVDPVDPTPIDPAIEQSKQTCQTTCQLKCKSEAPEKK